MKLKSILTALLFALCCMGATAQTTYTDALTRYFSVNGGMESTKDQMKTALVMVTNMLAGQGEQSLPKGYTAETLVDEYIEKQMLNDYVSAFVPLFAETMTIAQINKISDMYDSPEGRLAVAHNNLLLANVKFMADFNALCEQAGRDIAVGKKPRSVQPNASKERQRLFHQYYQESEMNAMLAAFVEVQVNALGGMPEDKVEAMRQFFNENLENLLLNASENVLTDADLKFMVKLLSTPEYKQISKTILDLLQDAQAFGMQIIMKYMQWVENHE